MTIKKILLRNWKPKLICLVLAIGIWMLVKNHVTIGIPEDDVRNQPESANLL